MPERRYERIAELFATALESGAPLADVAQAAGERVASASASRGDGPDSLMAALRDAGYEPVAQPDGAIRLRNCPFHALVATHQPLVCSANLAMTQGMTRAAGAEARLIPVLEPQAGYCCVTFKPAVGATD